MGSRMSILGMYCIRIRNYYFLDLVDNSEIDYSPSCYWEGLAVL